MAAIQGYVDVLLAAEKNNVSKDGYEYLKTINMSIKELLQLANELIDLSRMETGEVELYRQWVDVSDIINGAAKIVRHEFTKRNLSLQVTIDDNLPELYLDRTRINQIMLNLLSNAYKYTTEGGATVEVHQENGWINITVSDTGVGIKDSDKSKLFERFFRADDRTVQKAGGTGLGLSITKGLVELHGGTLSFASDYGVGTTFTIALPENKAEPMNN
jgi:signal transduction histidine kinase